MILFSFEQCIQHSATQSAVLLRHVIRPSMTLRYRDHIGWKSSKIISLLVSLSSLSADPNIMDLLQREHHKILTQTDPTLVELSVTDIRWHIVATWLEIAQWLQLDSCS